MTSTARAIKRNWKAATIIQPIIQRLFTPLVIYGPGGGHTHTHTRTHTHSRTHTHTHAHTHAHTNIHTHILWRNESDFKKPGARIGRCTPGLKTSRSEICWTNREVVTLQSL